MGIKSKQFTFLTEKKQFSQEFIDLLDNKPIINNLHTLEHYLDTEKFSYSKTDLDNAVTRFEKSILKQATYFCFLDYYVREQSKEWGDAGEEQVKTSFCRLLLKKKPDEELSYSDFLKFEEHYTKKITNLKISQLSLEEAKVKLKAFDFTFPWGIKIHNSQVNLPILLRFLGSKYTLIFTFKNKKMHCLMGEYSTIKPTKYEVLVIKKEIMRSGTYIMATVAENYSGGIFVRDEALWTIFHQKWVPVLKEKSSFFFSDPNYKISQAIKERVMSLYGFKTVDDLLKHKEVFFKDMRETIIFHELGHQTVEMAMLSPEEYGLVNACAYYSEDDIFDAIYEFLADFCPAYDKNFGAMYNMVRIAKKNKKRAERMFYIYLSDVWFYDTSDEYMYTYSDLIVLILLRYIRPDFSIDFNLLKEDLVFDDNRMEKDALSVVERIFELLCWDLQELKKIVQDTRFSIIDCQEFIRFRPFLIEEVLKKKIQGYQEQTKKGQTAFWYYSFFYVDTLSDSKDKLISYIRNRKADVIKRVLILSSGKKRAQEIAYDHRRFIKEKMSDLGLIIKTDETSLDHTELLDWGAIENEEQFDQILDETIEKIDNMNSSEDSE